MNEISQLEEMFLEEFIQERKQAAGEHIESLIAALNKDMGCMDGIRYRLNDVVNEWLAAPLFQSTAQRVVLRRIKEKIDGASVSVDLTIQHKTLSDAHQAAAAISGVDDLPPPPAPSEKEKLVPGEIERMQREFEVVKTMAFNFQDAVLSLRKDVTERTKNLSRELRSNMNVQIRDLTSLLTSHITNFKHHSYLAPGEIKILPPKKPKRPTKRTVKE